MAFYLWYGNLSGDLENPGNYDTGGGPPAVVPGLGDLVFCGIDAWYYPGSGTSEADWEANQTTIEGGIFNGAMTLNVSQVWGGTMNGSVSLLNMISIFAGTFNGPVVDLDGSGHNIAGGTFNNDLQLFGYLSLGGEGLAINHRVSFDSGATWLYSPNSPQVAAAADVRKAVVNCGVAGLCYVPAAVDVRLGVAVDVAPLAGTCAVPLPAQVVSGVPVDHTTGTAELTQAGGLLLAGGSW